MGISPNFCDKELLNLTLLSLPAQAVMAREAMNNKAVIMLLLRMASFLVLLASLNAHFAVVSSGEKSGGEISL